MRLFVIFIQFMDSITQHSKYELIASLSIKC